MAKSRLVLSIQLGFACLFASFCMTPAQAAPAFGPQQYNGQPKVQAQNVSFVLPQAGGYRLEVQNGKPYLPAVCSGGVLSKLLCNLKNTLELVESIASRISNGKITLNNQLILGANDINILRETISKNIQLPKNNLLKLELQGLSGSRLTLALYSLEQPDTQSPVITLVAPSDGQVLNSFSITISGFANEALDSILVNSQPLLLSSDFKSFSGVFVASQNGLLNLNFVARDKAGNSQSLSRSVNIQTVINHPPTAVFTMVQQNGPRTYFSFV